LADVTAASLPGHAATPVVKRSSAPPRVKPNPNIAGLIALIALAAGHGSGNSCRAQYKQAENQTLIRNYYAMWLSTGCC
jgi:hypothetical protein